jgi:hypothetical protein
MKLGIIVLAVCSLTLALAFTVNHAVNGVSCWGMHPGGPLNMRLFSSLRVLAVAAFGLGMCVALTRRSFLWATPMLVVVVWLGYLYHVWWKYTGFRIFTSRHNQGAENLRGVAILFGVISFSLVTALVVALRKRRSPTTGCSPISDRADAV